MNDTHFSALQDLFGSRFHLASVTRDLVSHRCVGHFTYRKATGASAEASGKFFIPTSLERGEQAPLLFAAGYEAADADVRAQIENRWVVATPTDPEAGSPSDDLLLDMLNVNFVLLHIARSLPVVDQRRIMLSGGSAGGWTALMLAAETFPLLGCAPDAAIFNFPYTMAYFAANEAAANATLRDGRSPAVPTVATDAKLTTQLVTRFGDDFTSGPWEALSPVHHFSLIAGRVHAWHSTADVMVPVEQIAQGLGPLNLEIFPPGFKVSVEEILPTAVRLGDGICELEIIRIAVPPEAPRYSVSDILDAELRSLLPPPVRLPLPDGSKRVTLCLLEEGSPEPYGDHFLHRITPDRTLFWRSAGVAPTDLSTDKLRQLLLRFHGEEWIQTGFHHLDEDVAERADVRASITAFRALSREHERAYRRAFVQMPAELQVAEFAP